MSTGEVRLIRPPTGLPEDKRGLAEVIAESAAEMALVKVTEACGNPAYGEFTPAQPYRRPIETCFGQELIKGSAK